MASGADTHVRMHARPHTGTHTHASRRAPGLKTTNHKFITELLLAFDIRAFWKSLEKDSGLVTKKYTATHAFESSVVLEVT